MRTSTMTLVRWSTIERERELFFSKSAVLPMSFLNIRGRMLSCRARCRASMSLFLFAFLQLLGVSWLQTVQRARHFRGRLASSGVFSDASAVHAEQTARIVSFVVILHCILSLGER